MAARGLLYGCGGQDGAGRCGLLGGGCPPARRRYAVLRLLRSVLTAIRLGLRSHGRGPVYFSSRGLNRGRVRGRRKVAKAVS